MMTTDRTNDSKQPAQQSTSTTSRVTVQAQPPVKLPRFDLLDDDDQRIVRGID